MLDILWNCGPGKSSFIELILSIFGSEADDKDHYRNQLHNVANITKVI